MNFKSFIIKQFTLLEENAISLIYRENENRDIYFNPRLNNILKKYPEIFLDDTGLSISNTQVSQLIDQLDVKPVVEKINQTRKERKPQSPYARPKANGGRKTKKKKTKKTIQKRIQTIRNRKQKTKGGKKLKKIKSNFC